LGKLVIGVNVNDMTNLRVRGVILASTIMKNHAAVKARIVALRITDLRSEYEAQLRAVSRLEEQLRRTTEGKDHDGHNLATAVRRELKEMLANNASIRTVLNELSGEAEADLAAC
jgi:hypothetical protein